MQLNVLVVEDDDFLRSVMAEAVALLGHAVIECANADLAMIALQGTEIFSLVVTDVRMPGRLDGFDLAQAIWSRWPKMPVIIMSGNVVISPGDLPANAKFLAKPVHLTTVHDAITELLSTAH